MGLRSVYRFFFCAGARPGLCAALPLLVLALIAVPASADRQDLDQLRQQVADHLQAHYAQSGAQRLEVEVSRLDPRLTLAQCEHPLDLQVNDRNNTGGSVSVHSRCQGAQPWSIYVPARVDMYRPVVVASRNLARGTTVDEGDIEVELHNTSQLRQGFVDTEQSVLGMELRRPVRRGEPFRANQLVEPLAVQRGDEVRLQAEAGGIVVSTRGTAMGNGRVGQQIRVMNNRSERIVTGEIVAPGLVRTVL